MAAFKVGGNGCPCCTASCSHVVKVQLCCGDGLSGSTVTYRTGGVGGPVVATGTTNGSGTVTFGIPAGGYTRIVTHSGYTTSTATVSVTCNSTVVVDLDWCFFIRVVGCPMDPSTYVPFTTPDESFGGVTGAAVSLRAAVGGATAWSGTTDGQGKFCCHLPPITGGYRLVLDKIGWDHYDKPQNPGSHHPNAHPGAPQATNPPDTFAPVYYSTVNLFFSEDHANYTCCKCADPTSNTLHGTIFGESVTLQGDGFGNYSGCFVKTTEGYSFDVVDECTCCPVLAGSISVPFKVSVSCLGDTVGIGFPARVNDENPFDEYAPTLYPTMYAMYCEGDSNPPPCRPTAFTCGDGLQYANGYYWDTPGNPPGCSQAGVAMAGYFGLGNLTKSCNPWSISGTLYPPTGSYYPYWTGEAPFEITE